MIFGFSFFCESELRNEAKISFRIIAIFDKIVTYVDEVIPIFDKFGWKFRKDERFFDRSITTIKEDVNTSK